MSVASVPKVSVIVPVYNASDKFVKCIDTIVNQSLVEIEIVLILDCPSDGTDEIAKQYAAKDHRIVIIENDENLHIGESRNKGLKIAKGEYIGFSDHDDFRELTMYEVLYNEAKKRDYDIVLGVNIEKKEKEIAQTALPDTLLDSELREFVLKDLISGGDDVTLSPIFANIHPNLYKNSFLEENNIFFEDTRICTPEDRIFQIKSVFYASKISYCQMPLYFHLIHKNSAVNVPSYRNCTYRANGKVVVWNFLKEIILLKNINFFFTNR
ncbi:MAG: glycosyltransferase family 2 protein [Paludibacteraceae bacterium]